MIYLIITIYICICTLYYDFAKKSFLKKFNFYTILTILILLSGSRYKVGGDTYNYMLIYESLPRISEISTTAIDIAKLQPFWILLIAAAKSIGDDFFVLQFLHAILVNSIIFYFIKSNTQHYFTGILLYAVIYYPYFNFEIMREALAVTTFLLSIKYYNNQKWIAYYAISIVALMFHYSAIILFILPIISKIKFNKSVIIFTFFLGIILNQYFHNTVNSLTLNFGAASSIKDYTNYVYTSWGLISILIFSIIYPACVINISESYLRIKNEYYNLLKISIFIGATSSMFFIFFRFLNYFTPLLILLLGEILHAIFRRKNLKRVRGLAVFFAFILILTIHCWRYFSSTSNYVENTRWYSHWYPYHSIFDEKTDPIREMLINSEFSN